MAHVVCNGPTGRAYPHLKLSDGQLVMTWGDLKRLIAYAERWSRRYGSDRQFDNLPVMIEDAGRSDAPGACLILPGDGASISIVEDRDVLLLGITSQPEDVLCEPDESPEVVQAERELREASDLFSRALDAEKEARAARDVALQPTNKATPHEQAANEQTQAARMAFMHSVFGMRGCPDDRGPAEPARYPDVSGGGVPYPPEPARYPDEYQIGAGENLED